METLEKKIIEELKILSGEFRQDEFTKEFEKTKKEFDELVDKGFVKKRGNNLLSPTDAHIKSRVWFNIK
jgi:hypothetical protein